MTEFFLAGLGAAWILLLLPVVMRAGRAASLASPDRFRRSLDILGSQTTSGSGRWVVMPESSEQLARAAFKREQRRRKRLFVLLLWGVLISLPVAAMAGGDAWTVQFALDAALLGYVVFLREAKRRRRGQRARVRRIRPDRPAAFYDPMRAGEARRT